MTCIVAVKHKGFVAIAGDTLTKYGTGKETAEYMKINKILEIQGNYLAVAGPASGQLILQDYFAGREVHLETAADIFKEWKALHLALKEEYYLRPDADAEDSFESSRMDVLIANRKGIFAVGSHRSVQELNKFYALGQGGDYALGAMYVAYNRLDLTAQDIAHIGVEAAAEFDDGTGLPIISYSIPLDFPG